MGHFLTIFNTHIELWNYKKKCIKKGCHTRQKNDITATVFVCAIICCYVWATVGDLLGDWIFNMTIIFYPTGLKYQTSFVVEMKDTWNGYRCCFKIICPKKGRSRRKAIKWVQFSLQGDLEKKAKLIFEWVINLSIILIKGNLVL